MKLKILALIAAAALSWSSASQAAMVSTYEYHRDAPASNTVWFPVDLFDGALGQLESVELTLDARVSGPSRLGFGSLLSQVDPLIRLPGLTGRKGWATTISYDTGSSDLLIHMTKLVDTTRRVARFVGDESFDTGIGLFRLNGTRSDRGESHENDEDDDRDGRESGRYAAVALSDFDFKVNYTYSGVTPDVSAVPVPASAWLMGSGVLAMGAFMRRRRGDRAALAV